MGIFLNPNGLNNTTSGSGTTANVPNASTGQAGKVQLSNAIDSDSQSMASTPLAVKTALTEAKNYADTLIDDLESTLEKYSFELLPTVQDQLEFDMPEIYNQHPDWFVNLLFFNSIKILESKYSIVEKVTGDTTQGYKLVLVDPAPDYTSAIYSLILIGGKALATGGAGNGTVTSINNISPDTTGNVQIPQATSIVQGVTYLTDVVDNSNDKAVTSKAVKDYVDALNNFVYTSDAPPTNNSLFWNKV